VSIAAGPTALTATDTAVAPDHLFLLDGRGSTVQEALASWEEMQVQSRSMPVLMGQLHELRFDYAEGDGYDLEPFRDFWSAVETQRWIRAWTGNQELDGKEWLVFGQDGSGGCAAFWVVRIGAPIPEQPIVFLGSEGQTGIVARNLRERLLAGGIGPAEAVEQRDRQPAPEAISAPFKTFAQDHGDAPMTTADVLGAAEAEFPDFQARIDSLCR
jgi:hypothetical protein